MENAIVAAVTNRQCLRIWYEPGWRIVEPHAFGIGSAGQFLLRVYQVEGANASGENVDWKLMRLDRIKSVSVLGDKFFNPRPGYKLNDKAMTRELFVQV